MLSGIKLTVQPWLHLIPVLQQAVFDPMATIGAVVQQASADVLSLADICVVVGCQKPVNPWAVVGFGEVEELIEGSRLQYFANGRFWYLPLYFKHESRLRTRQY